MTGALLAALLCAPASAEKIARVVRSDLPVSVPVKGSVVAARLTRIKADFDGRIEDVKVSSDSWAAAGEPLAYLASPEMAAMLDSRTTTIRETMDKRWQNVYRLQPLACPEDCYVVRSYVKNKQTVAARTLMFEVAELRLVGHVSAEESHWIRDGQTVEFWPADDPRRRFKTRVQRYAFDVQNADPRRRNPAEAAPETNASGATFSVTLRPDNYLPLGTKWQGRVIPATRKRAYLVPTEALLQYKDGVYLPVRVSTGVTTPEVTEIVEGIEREVEVLVVEDGKLKDAERHKQTPDEGALRKRLYPKNEPPKASEPSPEPATSVRREVPAPAFVPQRDREREDVLPDPDAVYSESPYDR